MKPWQNLIRVLTHEIMNSIAPISALAATISTDIKHKIQENEAPVRKKWPEKHYQMGILP